jgi:hypothetical protein
MYAADGIWPSVRQQRLLRVKEVEMPAPFEQRHRNAALPRQLLVRGSSESSDVTVSEPGCKVDMFRAIELIIDYPCFSGSDIPL